MKPGPESQVTVELVHRVSERVAKGIPIQVALQSEPVTYDAYRKHLQRHSELRAIQATAKIKFLDVTFDMITAKPGPMLRWLLERRHADVFGPNADKISGDDTESDTAHPTQTLAGVPEHLVDELRKQAP